MPIITKIPFWTMTFQKSKQLGCFSLRFVPVGLPVSKELRLGELDGREPFPIPWDYRFFSGSCF